MSHPADIKYAREHRLAELMNGMVRHLLVFKPSTDKVPDALINYLVLMEEEKRRQAEAKRRQRAIDNAKAVEKAVKRADEQPSAISSRTRSPNFSKSRTTTADSSKAALLLRVRPKPEKWNGTAAGLHRRTNANNSSQPFASAISVDRSAAKPHRLPPLERSQDPSLEDQSQQQAAQRGRESSAHHADRAKENHPSYSPSRREPFGFEITLFQLQGLPRVERKDYSVVVTVDGRPGFTSSIRHDEVSKLNFSFKVRGIPPTAKVTLQLWNCRVNGGRLCELFGEILVPLPLGLTQAWRNLRYGRDPHAEIEVRAVPLDDAQAAVPPAAGEPTRSKAHDAAEPDSSQQQAQHSEGSRSPSKEKATTKTQQQHEPRRGPPNDRSVAVIQAAYRRKVSAGSFGSRVDQVGEEKKGHATRRIQSSERKRRADQEVLERRTQRDSARQLKDGATQRIQSAERRRLAKSLVEEKARRKEAKRRAKAVEEIQAASRKRIALEDVEDRRSRSSSQQSLRDTARAAGRIQSVERSRRAKAEVEQRRSRTQSTGALEILRREELMDVMFEDEDGADQTMYSETSSASGYAAIDQDKEAAIRRIQSSGRHRIAHDIIEERSREGSPTILRQSRGRPRTAPHVDSAIRRIQSLERARRARGDIEDRRSRNSSLTSTLSESLVDAVATIQTAERSRRARDTVVRRSRSAGSSRLTEEAATRIQSAERVRKAKERVKMRRSQSCTIARTCDADREEAVRRIQSRERQRMARRDVADRRSRSPNSSRPASADALREVAARRIQSSQRIRAAQKEVENRRASRPASAESRDAAVRRIQSSQRIRAAQQEVDDRRSSRAGSPSPINEQTSQGSDSDRESAVLRMQSKLRQNQARQGAKRKAAEDTA